MNISEEKGQFELLCGDTIGIINNPLKKAEPLPERIGLDQALLVEGVYVAKIVYSNGDELVYSSLSGGLDLFYAYDDEERILYDYDFWNIAKRIGTVKLDYTEKTFFELKGYLHPGKTLFSNIMRLELGYGIYITKDKDIFVRLKYHNYRVDYDFFIKSMRRSIEDYLDHYSLSSNALLFSGGKDSALLATMLIKEYGINLSLYSAFYSNPKGFFMSEKDKERSLWFCKWLDTKVEQVGVDCDSLSFDDIRYLIPKMPFGAHPATIFEFLIRKIADVNKDTTLWTGQNADTVYGLGNTDSNLSSAIIRYFLTEDFLKSLNDTENQLHGKIVADMICLLYRITNKMKTYRAKNSQEYIEVAMNGINYMSTQKADKKEVTNKILTIQNVWQTVWDNYQSAHLTGMDHQVIRNVGSPSIRRVFPYSTVRNMMMFRSILFGFGDMWMPKKYISMYLKNMIGDYSYKKLYPLGIKAGNNENVFKFENKIVNKTNYGNSISSFVNVEGIASMQKLISLAWEKEILIKLQETGIIVHQ